MNEGVTPNVIHCPDCGASVARDAGQCWLCRRNLAEIRDQPSNVNAGSDVAVQKTMPHRQPTSGLSFRLSSLMLTVTLIAVCLGVLRMAPGIGIGLAVLATPAFVRTIFAARKQRAAGTPMTILEKLLAFCASLGIVTAIVTASCCTFYLTCWVPVLPGLATNNLDWLGFGLVIGVGLGVAAGIAVGVVLIIKLWPIRQKKPRTIVILVGLILAGLVATMVILNMT